MQVHFLLGELLMGLSGRHRGQVGAAPGRWDRVRDSGRGCVRESAWTRVSEGRSGKFRDIWDWVAKDGCGQFRIEDPCFLSMLFLLDTSTVCHHQDAVHEPQGQAGTTLASHLSARKPARPLSFWPFSACHRLHLVSHGPWA